MNDGERSNRFWFISTLGLMVAVFAAIAPTLSWMEFSGSMENLNVATAMEMRRSQNYLVPTLEGAPRISKPPLAVWITASFMTCLTQTQLPDPAAYPKLAREVRLSALVVSCLTILAVYFLGQTLASAQVGFFSAAIFASNYVFLRFGRQAITDVHLTLWVTVANVLLAGAVFDRKIGVKSVFAGVALGLAFMSKGPVSLVETLLPFAAYLAWRRMPRWQSIAISIIVAAIIAAPWFVLVALRMPEVWSRWSTEVTRHGATENASGNPVFYLIVIGLIAPWFVPLIARLIGGFIEIKKRSEDRILLAMFLLIVPLLVMSFFPDRKDRYALPMIPAASVLAASAMNDWFRKRRGAVPIIGATVVLMLIGQAIFVHYYAKMPKGKSEMKPLAEAIVQRYPNAVVINGRTDDKRVPVDLAIYMNRATVREDNFDPSLPRVLILQQRPGESDPNPAGWSFVAKSPRDRDWWWAFVQVPVRSSTQTSTARSSE